MVYSEAAAYNLSWGPVSWYISCLAFLWTVTYTPHRLYMSEIFPNRIRELGIAIGAASQWLFNFMLSQITPYAIKNIGWKTFLMFAIFNYSLVAYSYFVLKEVRRIVDFSKDILPTHYFLD